MASSDNMADQVANAAQNAVKSSDFSDLQSTIERVAGAAAESIGRGIAQASDGIRRGQEQYALIQERKRKEGAHEPALCERHDPAWRRHSACGRRRCRGNPACRHRVDHAPYQACGCRAVHRRRRRARRRACARRHPKDPFSRVSSSAIATLSACANRAA